MRACLLGLLLPLATPAPAAADVEARVRALSSQIVCNCDCGNKIVEKCYCGVADSLRAEIRTRLDSGDSDAEVLAHLVGRYGETILAAPTPQGFNLTAWAAPAVALLSGLGAAFLILRRWGRLGRASSPAPAVPSPAVDPYERAVEAELASRLD
jgi:cytochrome c-type biogenesis protein CcmH